MLPGEANYAPRDVDTHDCPGKQANQAETADRNPGTCRVGEGVDPLAPFLSPSLRDGEPPRL